MNILTHLNTVHHFSDGLYAKETQIPKNGFVMQHKHEYSHFGILSKGKVIVTTNASEKTYTAPVCIEIKAGVHHSVVALEDSVWYCVHATDEKDPEKVDQVIIVKE
jgi:quercetin dioxygenase-like cupin family protein